MQELSEKIIKMANKYAGLIENHIDSAMESGSDDDAKKIEKEIALLRLIYAEAISLSKVKFPKIKYEMITTKKKKIFFWIIYIVTLITSVSALIICCMRLL